MESPQRLDQSSKVVVSPWADWRPKCRRFDVVGSLGNGGGAGSRSSTATAPAASAFPAAAAVAATLSRPNTKYEAGGRMAVSSTGERGRSRPTPSYLAPIQPGPPSASGGFWGQIRVISRKIFCSESLKAFAAVP